MRMMIEEYGVEPQGRSLADCKKLLERNILEWRKSQVQAVVRDMPSVAVACLEANGYEVTPPADGVRQDLPEKLSRH